MDTQRNSLIPLEPLSPAHLTVEEARRLVRMGRTSFYRMAGVAFPIVKVGRSTRVPVAPLMAWAASLIETSPANTAAAQAAKGAVL